MALKKSQKSLLDGKKKIGEPNQVSLQPRQVKDTYLKLHESP
jgi:hypothetical protein